MPGPRTTPGEPSSSADPARGAVDTLLGPLLIRLVERLPIGVVSVAPDLSVDYLNDAARTHLPAAAIGEPLPEPWHGVSLRAFAQRLFDSKTPTRTVVEAPTSRLLELDGIAGSDGENALLLLQDMTSRERRRRVEREFVTNAAHELRTPIAAIASAIEVLQGGAKEIPADRDLFLGHLERESDRLGQLVETLLLLARMQLGQQPPVLELVEVRRLLDDVAAQLEPQDGVVVSVDCEPWLATLADPDLLRQAVWNVAANAATHTARGEIRITCRDVGSATEIVVLDTGAGMTEEEQAHVFERFYRAPGLAGPGFGLGLAIAREVARVLGGTLELESAPGVGTRVSLCVPSARMVA
jgi:signal transduction histidine kinase